MRLPLWRGSAKTRLRSDIDELRRVSALFGDDNLDGRLGALWAASCDGAADITAQLFVQNYDEGIDWGLKRHRKRLNGARLAAIYWWMLLYQLVLFRNRGVSGYDRVADFHALRETADALMEHLVNLPHIGAVNPGPWQEHWQRQVSLEAALGIYNAVMGLLAIRLNTEARVMSVSLFTSTTERRFNTITAPAALDADTSSS
ncbi:MAG: hypothetical protein F4Y44_04410 [Chloroflexi bacterium]|nr:hypothetical protein [Chloroflexota bacterium]